jgi:cold shock CspA family protein
MNTTFSPTQTTGIVKWFSKDKGFGYVVTKSGQEHYFNVRDVLGAVLPSTGDTVLFDSVSNVKGWRAARVIIETHSAIAPLHTHYSDSRETCVHCHKKMVPRMIVFHGTPQQSICPFCAGVHKSFNSHTIYSLLYITAFPLIIFFVFWLMLRN